MYARVQTICFSGLETQTVDVEVRITPGLPSLVLVGLPDRTINESKDRIKSAFHAIGLAMPAKSVVINFAPSDLRKEGAHYDLPVALGLCLAQNIISQEVLQDTLALGQLSLDGRITAVPGVLSAALHAKSQDKRLICPEICGGEAAWVGELEILAPFSLKALFNHFTGYQILPVPEPLQASISPSTVDFQDVTGQENTKRALEIAAVGRHNIAMIGPAGAGKSMLAQRFPTLLPLLTPSEALEVTQIYSVSKKSFQAGLITHAPFRSPHHSASMVALMGGGAYAEPGEISLAHKGVLFLDEWPEFSRQALESLRQPLESKVVHVARAHSHVIFPADFQLIAAMNPCPCGELENPERACKRSPVCGQMYQKKISGPLWDRIDITVMVEAHSLRYGGQSVIESSATIAQRVQGARAYRQRRHGEEQDNACTDEAKSFLQNHSNKMKLSMRSYHKTLAVARTLADMEYTPKTEKHHVAEALSYRRIY